MKKPDGGPALFAMIPKAMPGLTIRDYFAAHAMGAILAASLTPEGAGIRRAAAEHGLEASAAIASSSYELADAMLAEREK